MHRLSAQLANCYITGGGVFEAGTARALQTFELPVLRAPTEHVRYNPCFNACADACFNMTHCSIPRAPLQVRVHKDQARPKPTRVSPTAVPGEPFSNLVPTSCSNIAPIPLSAASDTFSSSSSARQLIKVPPSVNRPGRSSMKWVLRYVRGANLVLFSTRTAL